MTEGGRHGSIARKGPDQNTNISRSFHLGCAGTILYSCLFILDAVFPAEYEVSPGRLFGNEVVIDLWHSQYLVDLLLVQRLRGREYFLVGDYCK